MGDPLRYGGVALAGLLFSLGWWLLIDGALVTHHSKIPWYGYIPAVAATVAVPMLNMVSLDDLKQRSITLRLGGGADPAIKIALWLFFWTSILAGSWAGAISVMAVLSQRWDGVSLLLQPFFCIMSAYILLVARRTRSKEQDIGL